MGTPLFEVKLSDFEAVSRLRGPEKTAFLNKLTTDAGRGMADIARKRFSDVLSPKHRFKVGASGAASENLDVQLISAGGGLVEWAVIEGTKTYANAQIREGIEPGEAPDLTTLRRWAAQKKIKLRARNREAEYGAVSSYQRRSKKGKLHTVRAYGRRVSGEKGADRALYAIQQALYKHGTNRPPTDDTMGAHWWGLPPSGSGRFDYVVFVVRQEGYFEREALKFSGEAVEAYVDYLASGRKKAFLGKTFSNSLK